MTIAEVGINYFYQRSGTVGTRNNTNGTASGISATGTTAANTNKSGMEQDPLIYYQQLCKEFLDITFRLEDKEEAVKNTGEPYLGYNNSMNQIGGNYGENGQCSISIDISVIKHMQDDISYEQKMKGMIQNTYDQYSTYEAAAMSDGCPYVSVSFEDNNGQPMRSITQSVSFFSTEEELKAMWSDDSIIKYLEGLTGPMAAQQIQGSLTSGIIGLSVLGKNNNFYDVSARYAQDSTTENPVVEVTVGQDGEESGVYRININDINPTNATQMEMFALFSHKDAQSGLEEQPKSYMEFLKNIFGLGANATQAGSFAE